MTGLPIVRQADTGRRMVSARPTLIVSLSLEEPVRMVVVADHEEDERRLADHVGALLARRPGEFVAAINQWLDNFAERAA